MLGSVPKYCILLPSLIEPLVSKGNEREGEKWITVARDPGVETEARAFPIF